MLIPTSWSTRITSSWTWKLSFACRTRPTCPPSLSSIPRTRRSTPDHHVRRPGHRPKDRISHQRQPKSLPPRHTRALKTTKVRMMTNHHRAFLCPTCCPKHFACWLPLACEHYWKFCDCNEEINRNKRSSKYLKSLNFFRCIRKTSSSGLAHRTLDTLTSTPSNVICPFVFQ